jgi:hypothetical protein
MNEPKPATVAQTIASAIQARITCGKRGQTEWQRRHAAAVVWLCAHQMPSGSGFDIGTKIDFDRSTAEKLVFVTAFHHMNETGYTGWTEHTVTVRPAFSGFTLTISGRDRNGIKEVIAKFFEAALSAVAEREKAYPVTSAS